MDLVQSVWKNELTSVHPVDIETISSLKSPPPPAALAEDGPSDNEYDLPSHRAKQPGSPAFSTTSTADEEGSSPILPPLPAPTFRGRAFSRAKTPPSESHTDSSYYYTASWGSPYQQPPAAATCTRSHAHTSTSSSLGSLGESSEPDSPIRHLEFHTPFLRPAPTFGLAPVNPEFVSQDGLISAAVLANRARRPATGLTEDWIRQHTGGESAERNHWLSDDPGDSEHSSLSGSISGDNRDWLGQDPDPRTPTLKTFSEATRKRIRSRHRRVHTTETLKQEDFLDNSIPTMSLTDENGIPGLEMEVQSPEEERPPPPPPKEWRATSLPDPVDQSPQLPVDKPALPAPRLKKKIPWKGKNILVLLPWDNERGQKGKAPAPMSEKDVTAMMKEWEQLGYDTTGFNLGSDALDSQGGQGQSRSPWPPAQDMISEREQKDYRVSIPNRKEWDDYVQELKEAKLRALGVSFGDEELAPTISPAVSNMNSRRQSMQYPPLPFSPPLPTSSANSSHLTHHHQNSFSPVLMPGAGMSTSQSSNPGSIASPASMHVHMQGKYNPRHSVSFPGVEHPFGSPFQYPQQNSPTVWSPQQMLYQQGHLGHSRGGSPSVSLQNLGAIVSPASPFPQDGYFPQNGDVLAQMQQRQQILQNQLAHQQQLQLQGGARASPRLQEVREIPEEEGPSKSPSKTPEARQNRHNPSNSLQQEIDDAEYHLEEQMQRELEHEDYSPHSDKDDNELAEKPAPGHSRNISSLHQALSGLGASRYAEDPEDRPVLHHPQPHSRGHSLSQRPFQDSEESAAEPKPSLLRIADNSKTDLSDIETNPSNLGTPVQSNDLSGSGHGRPLSVASNPWADSDANRTEDSSAPKRGHGPKPSMSKLNVAAKEFKFDPSSSFSKPSAFSFNGNNFQNSVPFGAFAPPISATSSHFSHHSVSGSRSHINVAAPVFTPGRSEFSFSASGPSFRPDAPAFTPLKGTFSDSVGSGSDGPRTSSIFGNIDLSGIGISKPSKKSKAVPIVRPDSSHSRNLDDEVMEGKDGRITQGEGRFKRARGAKEDRDSVPLFAEPSMPLGETTREQSPPKDTLAVVTSQADKENFAPLEEDAQEHESAAPIKSQTGNISDSSPTHGKDFVPYEFNEPKQAEDFNAARPFTSRRYGSGLPAYGTFIPSASEDELNVPAEPQKAKGHKKSGSSLSATAKPFEFKPGAFSFKFGQHSEPTPAIVSPPLPSASLPSAGLSASKYARSPSPPGEIASPEHAMNSHESAQFQDSLPGPDSPPRYVEDEEFEDREPTFEEIDAVMRQLNEVELESAAVDTPRWTQPSSPPRQIHMPNLDSSSPTRLQPQSIMRSDAPSPSPGRFQALPGQSNVFGRVHEDPFTNQPRFASPVRLNTMDSLPPSEWDDVLSETEEAKLQPRAQFFDNHVNDLVGGLLAHRLEPVERTLENIQMSIDMMAARAPSSRRERRSISGALSDADDEDDEDDDNEFPRRSLSPRRDKKLEKIRAIINEALTTHQASRPQTATIAPEQSVVPDNSNILRALDEMKEQFGQSMRLDLRSEDLRNIVEEAVEKRLPSKPIPVIDDAAVAREAEYKAKIAELEERLFRADSDRTERLADLENRLRRADTTIEEEIKTRRAAEDRLAEVQRLLRISSEEEVRLREVVDEKELKIRQLEDENAQNVKTNQAAEHRLAEVQRLLRISSEEETRLRESMDEKELKIRKVEDEIAQKTRTAEEQRAKATMRIALLEAAQDNAQRAQSELHNRLNITENDLRETRQEVQRWQMEAERALEAARRHSEDAEQANETNKNLRRTIESLRTQMEESIRVREGFRGKLMDLQEDMAAAAREITEENARRAKKEQELIARQEVLDARLQAEARTRERLETEIERLEAGEREGMRAVSDIKKMEALLTELRMESHNAQKDAMRYQREFEEARESGLSEVQRTRHYMQAEIEAANNQVNVVREDLENQILRLRTEIDNVKLEADTARAKSEMLLEEAETSKASLLADSKVKHADELEDLQTRHERQLSVALEEAQRAEQHLLERLSLSSAKTEHLQDRVSHLEEKLEIASQAAVAAAAAAKTARSLSSSSPTTVKPLGRAVELPEKISPQALRESIMALQEQLQNRESTIEELEVALSTVDVEAPTKIQKCEDEIMWLRELLSVRKSDLQDIVTALQGGEYDPERVRDAAIRLNANLQMEEQERERAMNGGSALTLPNIASSLRDVAGGVAASPRVAQAVGPLAAAWGNWRKGRADSAVAQAQQPLQARSSSSTPSRNASSSQGNSSFLSGLLTPPASNSNLRSTSTLSRANEAQPTAFGSTGQRLTASQLANRPRGMSKQNLAGSRGSPAKSLVPSTPPMMRKSSYDADAREGIEDFSDAGFYDDDESTVEDGSAGLAAAMYGPGPTVGGKQVGSWR